MSISIRKVKAAAEVLGAVLRADLIVPTVKRALAEFADDGEISRAEAAEIIGKAALDYAASEGEDITTDGG